MFNPTLIKLRREQAERNTLLSRRGTEQGELVYGNPFYFQGRVYDKETELYHFRSRWYDPETGRWLSPDPIGISGGVNLYLFCNNNPVNFVDPKGDFAFWGGIIGGVLSAATELSSQLLSGKSLGEVNWNHVGVSAIVGAAGGFLGNIFANVSGKVIYDMGVTTVLNMSESIIKNADCDVPIVDASSIALSFFGGINTGVGAGLHFALRGESKKVPFLTFRPSFDFVGDSVSIVGSYYHPVILKLLMSIMPDQGEDR